MHYIAMQNMKKCAKRGQRNYNQRAWSSTLKTGDHVLVRNLTPRGGQVAYFSKSFSPT